MSVAETVITASLLRRDFTEFSSEQAYPESDIDFWLTVAYKLLVARRWLDMLPLAVELFVCHNLALEKKAKDEAANGAPPGMTTGMINNKSVDKVSIGYDTSGSMEEGAGHWNLTIYGTRFIRMSRMFGAGPVYLGAGHAPVGASGGAYQGPWPWNFPNHNQ